MTMANVYKPIPPDQVPPRVDVINSTWAMKQKASGKFRAHLARHGFKQREGVSYDKDDLYSPIIWDITVYFCFGLMLMATWLGWVADVKGAFLHGTFKPQHQVYMQIPKGIEKYYPNGWLLYLNKTLYGCKQAAKAFWVFLLGHMQDFNFNRNKADHVYRAWTDQVLVLRVSYLDDMIIMGKDEALHTRKGSWIWLIVMTLEN